MAGRLGIDIGETHADLLLFDDAAGVAHALKAPVSGDDPVDGIVSGIRRIAAEAGIEPGDIESIHQGIPGVTQIRRTAGKVGLLVTSGFEQIVQLARGQGADPAVAACVVGVRGVAERLDAGGQVQVPLDEADARESIRSLIDAGAQAIAIVLLHAYANPVHEQRLKSLVREASAEMPVTLSGDVLSEAAEFERAVAAIVAAAVRPGLDAYCRRLQEGLRDLAISPALHVMRSDGGSMTLDHAVGAPLLTARPGHAAGVRAAAEIAARAGYRDAIAVDMGGGATSVAIILDGNPVVGRSTALGGANLGVPSVEGRGAGAGSNAIARVTPHGALRIGPENAGVDPGPACLGKGGDRPTLLDANVALGLIPSGIDGSGFEPDTGAAGEALGRLADRLNQNAHTVARGIRDLANEKLYGALRQLAAAHGCLIADMALVIYGGAGPLHANALGDMCGGIPVLVTATPGSLSAFGFLSAAPRHEISASFRRSAADVSSGEIGDLIDALGTRAGQWLDDEGVSETDRSIAYEIDARYRSQGAQIAVALKPEGMSNWGVRDLTDRFETAFEQQYGLRLSVPVEFVRLRVIAAGRRRPAERQTNGRDGAAGSTPIGEQRIFLGGEYLSAPVFDGPALSPGDRIAGPALICNPDSTTVVHPGYAGVLDRHLTLAITPDEGQPTR